MSLEELLERAHFDMDISSLSRKLRGHQILTTKEAERIADALGTKIAWPAPPKRVL